MTYRKASVLFAVLLGNALLLAGIPQASNAAPADSNDRSAQRSSAAPSTAPATAAQNTVVRTFPQPPTSTHRDCCAASGAYGAGAYAARPQPAAVVPATSASSAVKRMMSESPQRSLW